MLFGGDRLHVNTSEIFVSFERVLSLSFKILSCVILLLLLYVYILVRALPNIGGSYLLHCRSIWFYALGFTEYYLLAILDVLNLHERRFGGHFFPINVLLFSIQTSASRKLMLVWDILYSDLMELCFFIQVIQRICELFFSTSSYEKYIIIYCIYINAYIN